jgi:hypothetical protein
MFTIAEVGFWLAVVGGVVAILVGAVIRSIGVTGTVGGTRVLLSEL